ncbi:MAG: universal stress protein [Nitrospirota bacterium]|jgi:nucleotide-binding universal stress UspA family protein
MKGEALNDERHILLAVDDSDIARRAVSYVGDFLGGVPRFRITLLNVIPEPPADFFETDAERGTWVREQRSEAEGFLERYGQILIQSGFEEDKVHTVVELCRTPSVAQCIMEAQKRLRCCTVVTGRRGISKQEEFIFGSTSNQVVHAGKNCAVWVVE